jgi:hypothetical protein
VVIRSAQQEHVRGLDALLQVAISRRGVGGVGIEERKVLLYGIENIDLAAHFRKAHGKVLNHLAGSGVLVEAPDDPKDR